MMSAAAIVAALFTLHWSCQLLALMISSFSQPVFWSALLDHFPDLQ